MNNPPVTTSAVSPIESLRRHTREVHERLHHHPRLGMMVSAQVTEQHYRWFLRKQYGFYAACMRGKVPPDALAPYVSPALAWLREDLAGLDVAPATVPMCRDVPTLAAPADWYGFLYVKEGALLGGQVMLKNLQVHLPQARPALHYLSGWGDDSGRRWRALTNMLNQNLQGESLGSAQQSALGTFTSFAEWLD